MSIDTEHLGTGPPLPRRAFVRSGLIATLAAVDHSATQKDTEVGSGTAGTALLILDFQVGVAPYSIGLAWAERRGRGSHGRHRWDEARG
jgi:hypothetical protein